ncbi:MAG TPA: LAGLIDADG family homing endonuclease [Aggregatilineales bacterium]|nr:LAGLIDADG family homing endonuclease [Aggregatilineales bacterium]
MVQSREVRQSQNTLHELGYKIFLDRYALKDMTRATLTVGDTVIVVVNSATGQREVGKVTALDLPQVTVELLDGAVVTRDVEHVDKPLETSPEVMMDRVARGIAEVEATPELKEEWTQKFRWLLDSWKFIPGGRILTAAGTEQELTFYNCFVIASPKDSRYGIIETLRQMTEIMSRGGGVGINISSLRPRHAYVKGVNGRSSGSVSWGALYSFVTGLIEQGGSRRGALMLILNDWHPDVFDFINSKRKMGQITNANISVGVSDELMEAVKADGDWTLMFPDTSDADYDEQWDGQLDKWVAAGHKVIPYRTVKAREVWNAIIESAWASAEPGVWFRERSNKMANSWYFNPLISTNPCVTGDTRIYTDQGMIKALDLFNDETAIEVVVDGRFGVTRATTAASRVFFTGRKPVYRLQTREGYSLRATADHRVMTARGWQALSDLKPGDRVHILNRKGGFGQQGTLELGRVLGWLVGDGTIKADSAVLSFFHDEKRELAPVFAGYVDALVAPLTRSARAVPVGVVEVADRDEARVRSARLRTLVETYGLTADKHQVPEVVFQGTEDMQRGFLQALFTADGTVNYVKGTAYVRLASSHLPLLEQVQQVLGNFGVASRIYRNRRPQMDRLMPDGHNGQKVYATQAQHELQISKRGLGVFADEINFLTDAKRERLAASLGQYTRGLYSETFTAHVAGVTYEGEEDVYDLTEPLTHSFTANGLIVHNCGEQPLGAFSVCNLGAINLARFYDEETGDVAWDDLRDTVAYATRFLDNVIDSTPYFFEENERVQGMERRVGLGTMGVAELMIRCKVRYGSEESVAFIDKLYKFIATHAYTMSADLAKEKGAFSAFDADKFLQSGFMLGMPDDVRKKIAKQGIRNVTLLTQAPTGTTGTMANTSTGVEPFFSWVYYRKSRLGLHEEQVPLVREWHEHHPEATELPDYFVTAMELSPDEHVKVQAAFQRWIDSAISKTCNVPNEYTVEQVSDLYMYMYDLGCKGGTIYRDGSRDEQVLMLKGDERAEKEIKDVKAVKAATSMEVDAEDSTVPPASPHRVYPRPKKLNGFTVNAPTPFGTAYVTMNMDEHGYPFEVFITAPGKAGSDLQADAEGLGRMISLSLRTTEPHNRREMLKLIIEQLRDIGGSRAVGFGPNRVISLPDSVARALEEQFITGMQPMQLGLPINGGAVSAPHDTDDEETDDVQPLRKASFENGTNGTHASPTHNSVYSGADLCPSCATISLIRAEGCRKCLTCGYSEC